MTKEKQVIYTAKVSDVPLLGGIIEAIENYERTRPKFTKCGDCIWYATSCLHCGQPLPPYCDGGYTNDVTTKTDCNAFDLREEK